MFLLSKVTNVFGQTQVIYEIDVGKLQVPVTLDGQIDKNEWDNDTIPYSPTWTVGKLANFVFRTKYDSIYTYMALYAPNFTGPRYTELYFDTKMTGSLLPGADGVYTLALVPSTPLAHLWPTTFTNFAVTDAGSVSLFVASVTTSGPTSDGVGVQVNLTGTSSGLGAV